MNPLNKGVCFFVTIYFYSEYMKVIISTTQIKRIYEHATRQGVAMDLDIYTQDMETPAGDFNQNAEDAIESVIEKLGEILSMIKSGKPIKQSLKNRIFDNLDDVDDIYHKFKYKRNLQMF
jgi:hypothetical protein